MRDLRDQNGTKMPVFDRNILVFYQEIQKNIEVTSCCEFFMKENTKCSATKTCLQERISIENYVCQIFSRNFTLKGVKI